MVHQFERSYRSRLASRNHAAPCHANASQASSRDHGPVPTVHLIHGFVARGKTTFAKKLEADTGGVRLSLDDWTIGLTGDAVHLDRAVLDLVWNLLADLWPRIAASGTRDVILDFGFCSRARRDDARARAAAVGAEVIVYDVTCPDDLARERSRGRNERLPGGYVIDDDEYESLRIEFDPLGQDEPAVRVDTC